MSEIAWYNIITKIVRFILKIDIEIPIFIALKFKINFCFKLLSTFLISYFFLDKELCHFYFTLKILKK